MGELFEYYNPLKLAIYFAKKDLESMGSNCSRFLDNFSGGVVTNLDEAIKQMSTGSTVFGMALYDMYEMQFAEKPRFIS